MREPLRALAFSGTLAAVVLLAPGFVRGAQTGDGGVQVSAAAPVSDIAAPSATAPVNVRPAPGAAALASDKALVSAAATPGAAAPANAERPSTAPAEDVQHALSQIKISWRTFDKCDQRKLCGTYFDSFGVGLTFADGTITPLARMQRMNVSEHDCIKNARAALEHGDRGLAVQWVMAAKLTTSPSARNWLGDHPDAVVAALHDCCF